MSDEHRQFLDEHTMIGGPYLDIANIVDLVLNLIADDNHINGSCLDVGQNALWR